MERLGEQLSPSEAAYALALVVGRRVATAAGGMHRRGIARGGDATGALSRELEWTAAPWKSRHATGRRQLRQ
jgi:hypothetical protein